MTTPYTYLLRHKPTNTVYYGVRFGRGCNPSEFWVSYFTSSKYIEAMVKSDGIDAFEFEIRKTFSSATNARNWETKVLKRIKAVAREDFINRTDNITISSEDSAKSMRGRTGVNHPAFGNDRVDVSLRNSKSIGELNPMFGIKGELAPCYGRTGEKHPMFGKTNPGASAACKEEVICPHCNKHGKRSGMQRWHFNNCKLKE